LNGRLSIVTDGAGNPFDRAREHRCSVEILQAAKPTGPVAFDGLHGAPAAPNAFAGKPTVVNHWATWCPPCSREMPLLKQAQSRRTASSRNSSVYRALVDFVTSVLLA